MESLNKTNASLDVAPYLGYYFFAGWQDSEYNQFLRFTDNGSRILCLTWTKPPSSIFLPKEQEPNQRLALPG
jgi:hypothetical protein